jgi:purine-nucleoside phosphorylase
MRYNEVEQARNYLLDRIGVAPDIAVIMGSGLSAVDEILHQTTRIHYVSIPHFHMPKVPGHRAEAVFGKAGGLNVLVFEGRIHYYEAGNMDEVTFCARVIGRLGAKMLLLTNAAGAINTAFRAGQLMLISDHINLIGANPLVGANEDRWGQRFVDLTEVYDRELRETLRQAALACEVDVVEGVYAAMTGPAYETPAEIRFLRTAGADAVGMSTVPEAIVARHMGVRVAGMSMLTNLAAGISDKTLNHDEVLNMATQMNADVAMVLLRFFEGYRSTGKSD